MSNKKFVILLVFLGLFGAGIFIAYYLLIAQPKIKADCLNAATRVTNNTGRGQTAEFNEEKYNECIKVF